MALPDFRNEPGLWRQRIQDAEQILKIDRALADLQALAIDAARIGDMKMRGVRRDTFDKDIERFRAVAARECGVRGVEADPQRKRLAERNDLVRRNEQVVKTLAAEVPGERRHRLRPDLDRGIAQLGEAVGEDRAPLCAFRFRQRPLQREPADIGDDADRCGDLEDVTQTLGEFDHPAHLAQRVREVVTIERTKIEDVIAAEQFRRMNDEVDLPALQIEARLDLLHIAVAEMEFDEAGF
jgi:hypothetical protein